LNKEYVLIIVEVKLPIDEGLVIPLKIIVTVEVKESVTEVIFTILFEELTNEQLTERLDEQRMLLPIEK